MNQQNKVKVSVIVPVYNAEKYLEQCMDSIVSQTLREIEIICVDDGSTDSSGDILRRYADADSRVRIIRQQNQYAGVARNNGMKQASGECLVFWDADDYFYPTALEDMYERITADDAEICVCGGNWYIEHKDREVFNRSYLFTKYLPETIPFSIATMEDHIMNFTGDTPWNKMYRRSFVEKTGIQFQPRRNANDLFFVWVTMCLADRITVVDKPLVCYRRNREGSLVSTVNRSPMDPFMALVDVRSELMGRGLLPQRSYENKCAGMIFYNLRHLHNWPVFRETYEFLQKQGIGLMGVKSHEEDDYYYVVWHNLAVRHLENDTPEEFLTFFQHLSYMQLQDIVYDRITFNQARKTWMNRAKKWEEANQNLKEKNSTFKERNQTLKEANGKLKDSNAKLKQKAETLADKNRQLTEKNKELAAVKEKYNRLPSVRLWHFVKRVFRKIFRK